MTEPHSTAFSFHGKKGNNLIQFDFNIAALNSGLDTWSLQIGIALALKNVPVPECQMRIIGQMHGFVK